MRKLLFILTAAFPLLSYAMEKEKFPDSPRTPDSQLKIQSKNSFDAEQNGGEQEKPKKNPMSDYDRYEANIKKISKYFEGKLKTTFIEGSAYNFYTGSFIKDFCLVAQVLSKLEPTLPDFEKFIRSLEKPGDIHEGFLDAIKVFIGEGTVDKGTVCISEEDFFELGKLYYFELGKLYYFERKPKEVSFDKDGVKIKSDNKKKDNTRCSHGTLKL